jgi:hypothetical protein
MGGKDFCQGFWKKIKYSEKYPGLFQGERDSLGAPPWITDDMTPHQAGWDIQEGTNLLPPEPDEGICQKQPLHPQCQEEAITRNNSKRMTILNIRY